MPTKRDLAKLLTNQKPSEALSIEDQTNFTPLSITQKLWDNDKGDDQLIPHSFYTYSSNQ